MKRTGRVVVVVQARMGSTRMPGKVLQPLSGVPMVGHVVARAARIPGTDRLATAIPALEEDDVLEAYLRTLPQVEIVRGSAEDVLDRYRQAARRLDADTIVRVTADCPLLCPEVSARVLRAYDAHPRADYASNTLQRTYPRGLDTEVFSRAALEVAASEASRPSDREHVTPFLWRQPDRFTLVSVADDRDASRLRWTVDTREDLDMVEALLASIEGRAELPDYEALLAHLERHPELARINRHVRQKGLEA